MITIALHGGRRPAAWPVESALHDPSGAPVRGAEAPVNVAFLYFLDFYSVDPYTCSRPIAGDIFPYISLYFCSSPKGRSGLPTAIGKACSGLDPL